MVAMEGAPHVASQNVVSIKCCSELLLVTGSRLAKQQMSIVYLIIQEIAITPDVRRNTVTAGEPPGRRLEVRLRSWREPFPWGGLAPRQLNLPAYFSRYGPQGKINHV